MIEVRLYATLREGRGKIVTLEPEKAANARAVLNLLEIPVEDVAILLINGFHKKPEDTVKDGDVLALFPPVGGG